MNTSQLIEGLKNSVREIPQLREIKEGFHHPHVKSWKTKLEAMLTGGGTTCEKALRSVRKIRNSLIGTEFVKIHTYLNQLEALERTLKQTIQTIEVFGRPEDKDILPHWGKPKSQQLAVGHLMVGNEEVSADAITVHEVLDCLVSLAEDSNDLTASMRDNLIVHLKAILEDDLLQPFLGRNMAVLLGHWPEFQTK